jgi:4-hydroxy-tetrahydrodipicolinate synthase
VFQSKVAGIFAATITPVRPDLSVDVERLAAYCLDVIDRGCDGVAPLGSAGEATSIPLATRLLVPKVLSRAGMPSERVIIGAGGCAAGDATAMAAASLDAGYPNLLVLPPFYYKDPDEDGLADYYDHIVRSAGEDGRIYLYHFPRMSTVAISVGLVQRLRDKWGDRVAGLKDSGGVFADTKAFLDCSPGFRVFSGSEHFLLDNLDANGAGVISATTNVTARLARKLAEALPSDRDTLNDELKEIRSLLQAYPMSAMLKALMYWHTKDEIWRTLLPPLTALGEIELLRLDNAVRRLPYFQREFSIGAGSGLHQ